MTVTAGNSTLTQRGPQIKGITRDAALLGCSRQHLYAVLHGKRRRSLRLLACYGALKAAQFLGLQEPKSREDEEAKTVGRSIRAKHRGPAIRGICIAAQKLGCSRQHLQAVVSGQRKSPRVLESYQALQAEQSTVTAPLSS